MNSLEQAVELLLGGSATANRNRAAALAQLEALVGDCERARRVWQEYLDAPGAPGDVFTLVTWMGPARVKMLHEIHLDARERAHRICELADPKLARFVLLEDDVIEMAFRGLKEGETGPEAARAAIETMDGRIAHLRAQAARLRSAPSRPAARKPGAKKAPAKKAAAGRSAKKPAAKRAGAKQKAAPKKAKKK